MKGSVKWFNDSKGFGFITTESGDEVFVHYSNIEMDGRRTLKENQPVLLEVVDSVKGLSAINVVPKR